MRMTENAIFSKFYEIWEQKARRMFAKNQYANNLKNLWKMETISLWYTVYYKYCIDTKKFDARCNMWFNISALQKPANRNSENISLRFYNRKAPMGHDSRRNLLISVGHNIRRWFSERRICFRFGNYGQTSLVVADTKRVYGPLGRKRDPARSTRRVRQQIFMERYS